MGSPDHGGLPDPYAPLMLPFHQKQPLQNEKTDNFILQGLF